MPPPLLASGVPSLLDDDVVCPPPVFAQSAEYTVQSNTDDCIVVLHRDVRLRGNVQTSGSCFVGMRSIVRGDIATVSLGNQCILEYDVLLKPPLRVVPGRPVEACPVTVGCATFFGRRVICEALSVGAFVVIEKDCCIGELAVIGHGVWLKQGSVVPPQTVLEPFFVYSGCPAQPIARLSEDTHPLAVREYIARRYQQVIIG